MQPIRHRICLLVVVAGLSISTACADGDDTTTTAATAEDEADETTATPPSALAMPTEANTGPARTPTDTITADEFIESGECIDARITDPVRVEVWNADLAEWNRTFTLTDCLISSWHWLVEPDTGSGDYPEEQYPVIDMTRTEITGSMAHLSPTRLTMAASYVGGGAFWAPCPDCAGVTYDLVRDMPVAVVDSMLVHPQGSPPDHTEALHLAGTGQGYRFTNTRFVQLGPLNDTATGALFFHGGDTRFDRCWFDWGGTPVPTYYPVYVYGRGPGANSNVVADSHIEAGLDGAYIYPVESEGEVPATYVDNVDFHTGEPIS